jgi:uncharacterized protein
MLTAGLVTEASIPSEEQAKPRDWPSHPRPRRGHGRKPGVSRVSAQPPDRRHAENHRPRRGRGRQPRTPIHPSSPSPPRNSEERLRGTLPRNCPTPPRNRRAAPRNWPGGGRMTSTDPLLYPREAACSDPSMTMEAGKLLNEKREEILAIAARFGASNIRLIGSVARGEATAASDIDFLVELEPGRSLFDLGGLVSELQALLGCRVDVATERGLRPRIRERVLSEAVAL